MEQDNGNAGVVRQPFYSSSYRKEQLAEFYPDLMRRLRAAGVGAASVVICGRDGRGGANGMSFSDARGRAVPVSRQDAAVVREIARFLFRGFSGDRIVHGVVEFDACSGIVEVFRKECGMIDVPAECDEENVEDGGLSY